MFSNDRKRTRSGGPASENDGGSTNPPSTSAAARSGPLRPRTVNTTESPSTGDGTAGGHRPPALKKGGPDAGHGGLHPSATTSRTGSIHSSASQSHTAHATRGKPQRPLRPLQGPPTTQPSASSSASSAVATLPTSRDRAVPVHHAATSSSTPRSLASKEGGSSSGPNGTTTTAAAPASVDAETQLRATWHVKRADLEAEVRLLAQQSTQLTGETQAVEDAIEGMLTEFEEDKRHVEVQHAHTVARYQGLMRALRAREDVCLAAKQRALDAMDASATAVHQLRARQEATQESIILATERRDALEKQLAGLLATETTRATVLRMLLGEEERMKDASYGLSGEVRELVLEMERLKAEKRKTEVSAMETEVARRELYSLCEELKGSIRVYCRVKGSVIVDPPTTESSSTPPAPSGAAVAKVDSEVDVVSAEALSGLPSPAKTGRGGSAESSVSAGMRATASRAAVGTGTAGTGGGGLRSGRSTTRSSVTTAAAAADDANDGDAEPYLFSYPDRTSVKEFGVRTEVEVEGEEREKTSTTTAAPTLLSTTDASADSASSAALSTLVPDTAEVNVGGEPDLPFSSGRTLTIHQTRSNATSTGVSNTEESFTYDRVFPGDAHQAEVYRDVEPLVRNAVDGYRVCVFAYGQTGSGKTFTMEGDLRHTPAAYGVTPRALRTILQRQDELTKEGWSYELSCTFIEIYNDVIRDLFQSGSARYEAAVQQSGNAATHHTIKHTGDRTQITNVSEKRIHTMEEFFALYKQAVDQRSTAKTELNDKSSRSHCVFTLYITGTNATIRQRSEGVLCLVDLAGSERVNESGVQGKQFKEAVNINRSLLDLGKCIRALRSGAVVPWRNCKLTYLLQNYLGAKGGKMLMIVTVSNLRQHAPESMNSLRFAARVQETFVGTSVKRVVNMM